MESDQNIENESQDNRRKRITKACDSCNRRKTRCDGLHPICGQCKSSGLRCTYNRIAKKRGPKQGHIREMEAKIRRMETLLQTSRAEAYLDFMDGDSYTTHSRQYSLPVLSAGLRTDTIHYPSTEAYIWNFIYMEIKDDSGLAYRTSFVHSGPDTLDLYTSAYKIFSDFGADPGFIDKLNLPMYTNDRISDERPPLPSPHESAKLDAIVNSYMTSTRKSIMDYWENADMKNSAIKFAIGALASITDRGIKNEFDGVAMYLQACKHIQTSETPLSLDNLRALCSLAIFALGKGAIRSAYLLCGMGYRIARHTNLFLDSASLDVPTSKVLFILYFIDFHLSFFFSQQPFIQRIPEFSYLTQVPSTNSMSLFSIIFQLQQIGKTFVSLTRILTCLNALYGYPGSDIQELSPLKKEIESTKIEKELREWFQDPITTQYIRTNTRSFGKNYTQVNDLSVLDPSPWEVAFIMVLYHTGVLRLYREKVVNIIRFGDQNILNCFQYSLSKQAVMSICTILEILASTNNSLDYMSPFLGQCLYESGIFCAVMALVEPAGRQTARNLLETHIRTFKLFTYDNNELARYQSSVLSQLYESI